MLLPGNPPVPCLDTRYVKQSFLANVKPYKPPEPIPTLSFLCCATSGTDVAHAAGAHISYAVRACYAMSGTDIAYA
eukprot:3941913-Rhodomonas_salina.7